MLVALLELQLVLNQYCNLSQARADTTSTMCVLYSTLFVYSCRKWSLSIYQYISTLVYREGTSSRSRRPVAGATGGWPPNQCINHPDFSQDAKIDCELWSHSASPTNNRCHYFTPSPPPPTIPLSSGFVYCTQMKCKYFIVRKEIVLVGSVCIC